jgi:hypothetical protein
MEHIDWQQNKDGSEGCTPIGGEERQQRQDHHTSQKTAVDPVIEKPRHLLPSLSRRTFAPAV